MKKVIAILLLGLLLAGCAAGAEDVAVNTEPTPPVLDETRTPQQLLEEAVQKLEGKEFTLRYGAGWGAEQKLTVAENPEEVRNFLPNENFFADFSALELTVVPSKTGTMCYQAMALNAQQLCKLLCNRSLTDGEQQLLSQHPDGEGTVQIVVDAEGAFQSLQVDLVLGEELWMLKIAVEK